MKLLLILLILFSIIVGMPTNLGYIALYGIEFSGPISLIRGGGLGLHRLTHWVVLLIAHALLFVLPFIKESSRIFGELLFWIPLMFILVFTLFDLFALFFLIPFIIIWIIALHKQRRKTRIRDLICSIT